MLNEIWIGLRIFRIPEDLTTLWIDTRNTSTLDSMITNISLSTILILTIFIHPIIFYYPVCRCTFSLCIVNGYSLVEGWCYGTSRPRMIHYGFAFQTGVRSRTLVVHFSCVLQLFTYCVIHCAIQWQCS